MVATGLRRRRTWRLGTERRSDVAVRLPAHAGYTGQHLRLRQQLERAKRSLRPEPPEIRPDHGTLVRRERVLNPSAIHDWQRGPWIDLGSRAEEPRLSCRKAVLRSAVAGGSQPRAARRSVQRDQHA